MNTYNLIYLRKRLKLKQEDMAKLIGVDRTTYTHYEKGDFVIPLVKLNTIANKYDCSLDYLAGISDINRNNFRHIDINFKEIGKNIRTIRKNLGLTQTEFAERLHCNQSVISKYESGLEITVLLLIDYAKITGETIDFICNKLNW